MKKKLFVLTAAAGLALSALPATGFAHANEYGAVRSLSSPGDLAMLESMLNRSGTLPTSGENHYLFSYDTSYGSTISYYLEDKNRKGLSIYIYNSSNTLVASGYTSASNNWQFTSTFKPDQVNDDYTVTIASNDGNGGNGYDYRVTVRAY